MVDPNEDRPIGAHKPPRAARRLGRWRAGKAGLLTLATGALLAGGGVARAADHSTPAASAAVATTTTSTTSSATTTPSPAAPTPVTTTTSTTTSTTSTGPQVGVLVGLTDYAHEFTRWAGTGLPGEPIRSGPATHDRTIAHLHLFTEDGLPEVYQLIAEELDKYGTMWVHIAVPMRPNGVTGWVPADDLTQFNIVRELIQVDLKTRRITLFDKGKVIFHAPVGIGKPSTPTPPGRFWVREKFPVNPPVPLYGPYAIGTSDYSTTETDWPGGGIIGIHGTDQPNLVPGDPSHGCVRLRNPDITRLYKLVQIGTPIVIVQ